MGLDVLNPVSLKKLKGIGGFTFASDALIDNVNFWRAGLLGDATGGGLWTRLTDPPSSRVHFGMDIVGDDIYFLGSYGAGGVGMSPTKYNVTTNSYTILPQSGTIPSSRDQFASGISNGFFYVFGGAATNQSYKYQLSTGIWTSLAPMPISQDCSGCFGNNGLFYTHGGSTEGVPLSQNNSLLMYNPSSNVWTTLAAHGPALEQSEMTAIGDCVYTVGGVTSDGGGNVTYYSINDRYNYTIPEWEVMYTLPSPRNDHFITVRNGEIWCIGGHGYGANYTDIVRYNPSTNLWITDPTPAPVAFALGRCVTHGVTGDIYVNSNGQMWKYSSTAVSKFAVERFY